MPEPKVRVNLDPEELANWNARKKHLAGRHLVPVEDVFTPAYVQKHLGLADFDAMLTECGFPLDLPSLENLTTEQDLIWDEMIRSHSNFSSWVDLFANAGEEWARRKIAGEPIPPPRSSSPAPTEARFPTREDLERLRDVAAPPTALLPPAVDPARETFDPENIPASQVESWSREGKAHFFEREFKGLGFAAHLFVVYLRSDQWTQTLLLARDPRRPVFRVWRRLDGFVPPTQAKELYFHLLSQSLLQGEGTVWVRLLRFLGIAESESPSSTFDLSIDLFNSVRSRDRRALASALEAIAQRTLPAGEALDAILSAARFIGELPDEAMELSLDLVELILSIIGLIPGAGTAADASSGVVAFAREDYLGATLAGAAVVPMVGAAAGVARALQKLRQIQAKLAALSRPLQKILLDTLSSIGSILGEWASAPIGSLFDRMKGVFDDAAERLRIFAKGKEPAKPSQPPAAPISPDVNTPATPPTPNKPPDQPASEPPSSTSRKSQLPKTNGKWDGPQGESGWLSDKPEVLAITKGKAVPYKNQRPDFSEWVVEEFEFESGELTGDQKKDTRKVLQKLVKAGRFRSQEDARKWLSSRDLTIHHETATKMQVIPIPLNKLSHTGSASDLRNQK